MQLRLVSIDIGQPGAAAILGFQVLDHRDEVIGKGSVSFGPPGLPSFIQGVAAGARWKLLELEEPSQPAAYANVRLVHITADGAGVRAVLDQLPNLLAGGEPA